MKLRTDRQRVASELRVSRSINQRFSSLNLSSLIIHSSQAVIQAYI